MTCILIATCRFVTFFWPKEVKASKLEGIHAKMMRETDPPPKKLKTAQSAPAPRPSNGSSKKPRPSDRGF